MSLCLVLFWAQRCGVKFPLWDMVTFLALLAFQFYWKRMKNKNFSTHYMWIVMNWNFLYLVNLLFFLLILLTLLFSLSLRTCDLICITLQWGKSQLLYRVLHTMTNNILPQNMSTVFVLFWTSKLLSDQFSTKINIWEVYLQNDHLKTDFRYSFQNFNI